MAERDIHGCAKQIPLLRCRRQARVRGGGNGAKRDEAGDQAVQPGAAAFCGEPDRHSFPCDSSGTEEVTLGSSLNRNLSDTTCNDRPGVVTRSQVSLRWLRGFVPAFLIKIFATIRETQ